MISRNSTVDNSGTPVAELTDHDAVSSASNTHYLYAKKGKPFNSSHVLLLKEQLNQNVDLIVPVRKQDPRERQFPNPLIGASSCSATIAEES